MPKLKDEELIKRATKDFKDARAHTAEWRTLAKKCYDFKAGNQWSDTDVQKMQREERPIITFNRITVFVSAVGGLEASNRQETTYLPEEVNDTGAVDIANQGAKWVKKKCDAEDEQSAAWEDLVTCGMGFTESFVDFSQDLDGKICEEQFDPLEAYWDAGAKKRNIVDAKWVGRIRSFFRDDAEDRFPKVKNKLSGTILGESDFFDEIRGEPHDSTPPAYQGEQATGDLESRTGKIRVLQYQYFTKVDIIRAAIGNQIREIEPKTFRKLNKELEEAGELPIRGLKQVKRKYFQAFISGNEILEHEPLSPDGTDEIVDFTIQAMTGHFDRNNGTFNGLVKNMIDPQNWANKYFSQAHDYFNSGIKSPIWYETGAIKDISDFEINAAKPNHPIEFEDGALQQKKVIRPEPPKIPSGLFQLHDFAVNALPSVTGLNPELLGLAGRDQPGILEAQRKQAGLTILATLFDSLRHYRIRHGRILLWQMRNFMPTDRLLRIVGQKQGVDVRQMIAAFKSPDSQKFDINVGEAPTSPNMKEKIFGMLIQIMQVAPNVQSVIAPLLVQYSPLPLEITSTIAKAMQQAQEKTPEQQTAERIAVGQGQADIKETLSKALLNEAKAQAELENIDIKDTKVMQDFVAKLNESSTKAEVEEFKAIEGRRNAAS